MKLFIGSKSEDRWFEKYWEWKPEIEEEEPPQNRERMVDIKNNFSTRDHWKKLKNTPKCWFSETWKQNFQSACILFPYLAHAAYASEVKQPHNFDKSHRQSWESPRINGHVYAFPVTEKHFQFLLWPSALNNEKRAPRMHDVYYANCGYYPLQPAARAFALNGAIWFNFCGNRHLWSNRIEMIEFINPRLLCIDIIVACSFFCAGRRWHTLAPSKSIRKDFYCSSFRIHRLRQREFCIFKMHLQIIFHISRLFGAFFRRQLNLIYNLLALNGNKTKNGAE